MSTRNSRKKVEADQPIIAAEILNPALFVPKDEPKAMIKCSVCGSATTDDHDEHLCWVCRRLKISAWRDVEQQMPAQE